MSLSIFGGTGFIGKYFVKNTGFDVEVVNRGTYEAKFNNILYLISTTSNNLAIKSPYLTIETNLIHLLRVLEENKKKFNSSFIFNFISSWFVYGNCEIPAKEEYQCNPSGFYSITKRTAEQLLIDYCIRNNIQYRIFRLANIFGEGDKYSENKNILQYMFSKLLRNEDFYLEKGGKIGRDYVYVEDCVKMIENCLKNTPVNDIYNIGSGKLRFLKNILFDVKRKINSSSKIEIRNNFNGNDYFYLDISKIKRYGCKVSFDFNKRINNLLEYMKDE